MRFFYWGLTVLVAIACSVFAVFNGGLVVVDFWPLPAQQISLYAVVLGALLLGFLVGMLIAWIGHLGLRRERARLLKQTQRLQTELDRRTEPAPPGRSLAA